MIKYVVKKLLENHCIVMNDFLSNFEIIIDLIKALKEIKINAHAQCMLGKTNYIFIISSDAPIPSCSAAIVIAIDLTTVEVD